MKIFYSKTLKNYFNLTLVLFISELIFRAVSGLDILSWSTLRIFIGINIVSLVLGTLYSFCGRIAGNILTFLTAAILSIYGIAQAGFENYLGTYMSFGTTSQADAVRDYITDYFASFDNKFYLILLPLILLIFLYFFVDRKIHMLEKNDTIDFADKFDSQERKTKNTMRRNKDKKTKAISIKVMAIAAALVLAFVYNYTLTASSMQNEIQLKSTKELFSNPDLPNLAMDQFGFTLYGLIDIKSTIKPEVNTTIVIEETEKVEKEKTDFTRYIDDYAWERVLEKESNNNYRQLSKYYINKDITDENQYTGIFENKNLIVIMMESTTNVLINKEFYPNIYKLYSEGWAWDNAYSPRNSCSTGNNEMSGMVSLFTINNSCTANNYKNNKYPESIFNLFKNKGYKTSSFHNYTDQYYYRQTIHPNMGSDHFYGVEELAIPYSNVYQEWPSDVELVEKFLEKTEEEEKFMVWLTSVTAHQPYTQSSQYGDLYLDEFSETGYNISLKRYMSKLKIFDEAIGELIKGLEKQGKLDDTVIVMYADHYPYGLTQSTLNEYFDYDVNVNNEVDRTPFIIYNSEMSAKKFTEYTTYMNIVPTVANLFNLDYDPRLYAGFDILSNDYENRVVFADGSWQDEVAFYNATKGTINFYQSTKTYTSDEIRAINNSIKNRIAMSNLAIKTDYFNYLNEEIFKIKETNISTSNNIEASTEENEE